MFVDDHARFSSHMNRSSWAMGGGRMELKLDDGEGRRKGSHLRMKGKAFGISLYLDEVITEYRPPRAKAWETAGNPKLLIVGNYRMRVLIDPARNESRISVSIEYDLPPVHKWLGRLFGGQYARWCVDQMVAGVAERFQGTA